MASKVSRDWTSQASAVPAHALIRQGSSTECAYPVRAFSAASCACWVWQLARVLARNAYGADICLGPAYMYARDQRTSVCMHGDWACACAGGVRPGAGHNVHVHRTSCERDAAVQGQARQPARGARIQERRAECAGDFVPGTLLICNLCLSVSAAYMYPLLICNRCVSVSAAYL